MSGVHEYTPDNVNTTEITDTATYCGDRERQQEGSTPVYSWVFPSLVGHDTASGLSPRYEWENQVPMNKLDSWHRENAASRLL